MDVVEIEETAEFLAGKFKVVRRDPVLQLGDAVVPVVLAGVTDEEVVGHGGEDEALNFKH